MIKINNKNLLTIDNDQLTYDNLFQLRTAAKQANQQHNFINCVKYLKKITMINDGLAEDDDEFNFDVEWLEEKIFQLEVKYDHQMEKLTQKDINNLLTISDNVL